MNLFVQPNDITQTEFTNHFCGDVRSESGKK